MPDCPHEFLIAVDVEDRRDRDLPLVRLAAGPIAADWLLDHVTERESLEWNRKAERVEKVRALVYDQLVIDETRVPAEPSGETAAILASKVREVDIGRFVNRDELDQLNARAAFAGISVDVESKLAELCRECASFRDLESCNVLGACRPPNIDLIAPERIRLRSGREIKVHYEASKPPWIESRLQDFFGIRETPRVNGVPIVVHLLAPNRRPVQVTSDLAGFWDKWYPQVRRELSRRYPKHHWPEKP